MDDFLLLVDDRSAGRRCRGRITAFVTEVLALRLNARRTILAPLSRPCDVLGYVHHPDGRIRIRRRSIRRLWRRLPALARRVEASSADWPAARASVASWFGLTAHADAFRLSRAIFAQRDVRHIGKRLLVCAAAPPRNESR